MIQWKEVDRTDPKGVTYKLPRLQHCMADPDIKLDLFQKGEILPWSKPILELKEKVEQLYYPQKFDYVLLNLYRNGEDKIGPHSDGIHNIVISSFSFGATRRFVVFPVRGKKPKYTYSLTHGSLIVMRGDMQKGWKHMIPAESGLKEPRINLKFRKNKEI